MNFLMIPLGDFDLSILVRNLQRYPYF